MYKTVLVAGCIRSVRPMLLSMMALITCSALAEDPDEIMDTFVVIGSPLSGFSYFGGGDGGGAVPGKGATNIEMAKTERGTVSVSTYLYRVSDKPPTNEQALELAKDATQPVPIGGKFAVITKNSAGVVTGVTYWTRTAVGAFPCPDCIGAIG